MSYRCNICRSAQPPRQAELRHVVYRHNRTIEQEVAVCTTCKGELDGGLALATLRQLHARYPTVRILNTTTTVGTAAKLTNGLTRKRKRR